MAVSGLERDFTDDEKDDIIDIIEALEEEDKGFLNSIGDWFDDGWQHVSGFFCGEYDVADYLGNIDEYHKKIMDKKNTSVEQIDKIFENVNQVDRDYSSAFNSLKDRITTLKDSVTSLADVLDPSPVASGGEFKLAMDDPGVNDITDELVDYYYKKLKDGDEYDWELIGEMMEKDPSEISEAEYSALCKVIDSFSEGDEVDTENYNRFLNECYINPQAGGQEVPELSANGKVPYYISPVFEQLTARYTAYSFGELQQQLIKTGGKVDDNKTGEEMQRKIFNITVLQDVVQYGKVSYRDIIVNEGTAGGYLIYGDMIALKKHEGSEADKYDYDINVTDVGEYSLKTYHNGNELYDKIQGEEIEFLVNGCDDGYFSMATGMATVIGGFGPGALPEACAVVCTYQALYAPVAAEEQKQTYLNIGDARSVGRALESCQVSASITIDGEKVKINYANMDKDELDFLLYMYNDRTGNELTSSECQDFLFNGNNDLKDKTMSYSNWYYDSGDDYIKGMLNEYSSMQKDFDNKKFNDLTLDEKKEVYKKYKEIRDGK